MILSSISGFIHITIFIFCSIFALSSYISWKESKENNLIKNMTIMFIFAGIFMLILGITDYLLALKADFIEMNPNLTGYMFAFAHIFIILAVAFYAKIPFGVLRPGKERAGFLVVLGVGLIPIIIAFTNLASLSIENRVTHYNVPLAFTATIGIWALVFMTGFGALFFFFQAFKLKDRFLKTRSAIMGTGFLIWSIGGPLHDVAETGRVYIIANLLLLLAFIVIFIGVFIGKLRSES